MKLVRHGAAGREKPGLVAPDGSWRDLAGRIDDFHGPTLSPRSLAALAEIDVDTLPSIEGRPRLGPCTANIGKMVCIGLNYADHCAESNVAVPTEPVMFIKGCPPTGAGDDIVIPKGSTCTDWEVELAVVIGTRAQHVSEQDALSHVAGYAVFNDVSERQFQLAHGGGTTKGKSSDSFAPIGPWLVTRDEVADPQNLPIWLEVNGDRRQDGHTGTMVFSVAEIIAYLSRFLTLYPGDVIATGTPPGVGMGRRPSPVYLRPGDQVRLGIDGLGEQNHDVVAFGGVSGADRGAAGCDAVRPVGAA